MAELSRAMRVTIDRAQMVPPPPAESPPADPASLLGKAIGNPPLTAAMANTQPWRAAEIPAANGHGNARAAARVMAALACGGTLDGVRLVGAGTLERAIAEQCYGRDLVTGFPIRWGLGFMMRSPDLPLGPNPRTFGHGGWGGSLAIADLDARVSWACVRHEPHDAGNGRRHAHRGAGRGAVRRALAGP